MPVYSQQYNNRDYEPPMPVVEIALRSPKKGGQSISLLALVDSGSDATMLPMEVLQSIGARFYRVTRIRGVTGEPMTVDTYHISINLGPYTIHGIEAVALPKSSEAILGRDVLNQLELTLNGPAQETWIA